MHVEVVYALQDVQHRVHLELLEGATVRSALEAVRRIPPFDGLDLTARTVGIFGRIAELDEALGPDDRVEIYRPLVLDPKEARRQRAEDKT
jgi:putative ubiquitin-RnfH superfamily antitoxin RatB of RatAB toxin-antitoxin module